MRKTANSTEYSPQIDHGSAAVRQHQELVERFAGCLLEEYENATTTHSYDPQWMRQLLLPHLEEFHRVSNLAISTEHILQKKFCYTWI